MIESFLRRSVPRPVLRKLAVFVNTVKINTFDKLVFPEASIPDESFVLLKDSPAFPELHKIIKDNNDQDVSRGLSQFNALREKEYILDYREGCYIDPVHGWAITQNRELIKPSLANAEAKHLKRPSLRMLSPSKKKIVHLKKAISLRDSSERAYFHFYNDVVAKIPFLIQHGINPLNVPVIISSVTFYKPFFQELLKRSPYMSAIKWRLQKDEIIYCDETIFCRPKALKKDYYDWITNELNFTAEYDKNERIFISRDPKRLRYIINMEELLPVLNRYHFKIIDADDLSLEEQARLLSGTRYLVAIHGAGLTNMIYRKKGMLNIIEIFPPAEMIPYHYAVLAHRYKFRYDGIIGETYNTIKGHFRMDPMKLERAIIKTLQS